MSRPVADQAGIEEAALWHARLDAPDMDWEVFGAWLDADPAHRIAYDAVALLDAEVDEARHQIADAMPANDPGELAERPTSRRGWWMGGGIAVALGLVTALAPQIMVSEAMVAYATGPGETGTIALGDGSRIILDRNSRIAVREGRGPEIEVASGNAWFDIRHDPSRALLVKAGDYEVRDIGTRFEVARSPGHIVVAVDEGQVVVGPSEGHGTTVAARERIDIVTADGSASVRQAGVVAAWRQGQLNYNDTPLSLVAADVARYAGRPVSVDPSIADMRVSGVLTIGDGSHLVGQIEALLPIRAVAQGNAVRLVRGTP